MQIKANEPDNDGNSPLQTALGAKGLMEDQTEVFKPSDLDQLGVAGYLEQGCGVAPADIDPLRPQLAAIKDAAVVVFSSAFGGVDQKLTITAPLRHIATFEEEKDAINFEKLPSQSAKMQNNPPEEKPAKKPVSDAAMSGRVATVVLLFIFVFTALFIWVGS